MKNFDVTLRSCIKTMKPIHPLIKQAMVSQILKLGVHNIEVTSFENHPQFQDQNWLSKLPDGPDYYGYAINYHSYDLLRLQPKLNGVSMSVSVKDAYKTLQERNRLHQCFGSTIDILYDAKRCKHPLKTRVYLTNAFDPSPSDVLDSVMYTPVFIDKLVEAGADEVILVDQDKHHNKIKTIFDAIESKDKLGLQTKAFSIVFYAKCLGIKRFSVSLLGPYR